MRRWLTNVRMKGPCRPCALGAAITLTWATAVLGQGAPVGDADRTGAEGPYPTLPGAVTKAPDGIGADAPFDVAEFFAPMPRDRNAAPLYLDALFEFGTEMASCFPEGPGRDRRRQAAADRMRRYMELEKALQLQFDPESVAAESIDAVIALYETGFRKIAEAQRRDRCVFETGVGINTLLGHVQASRQVARIASLRVRRAVERGDYDAAIRELEVVLRLVRDLRPRGFMITQLVAVAMTQVACNNMVNPILAGPGLRVEHCDRLLRTLLDHEASSPDGYAEGLRSEYMTARFELAEMARKQPQGQEPTWRDDLARAIRGLNDGYRTALDLDGVPFARRLEKLAAVTLAKGNDPFSRMVRTIEPSLVPFAKAIGRMQASLHASECMIVMRRWQLNHRGLPRVLAVAVKEAGLKTIPIDPYDGRPMRVALLGSPRMIYSVGQDGRDDGGQKDSRFDTLPGDLIYRMPEVEDRR